LRKSYLLVFLSLGLNPLGLAWAQDVSGFSGNLRLEGGESQFHSVEAYSYGRLFVQEETSLDSNFNISLAGEADGQAGLSMGGIPWPTYPQENILRIQWDNLDSADPGTFVNLQLDRAYGHWASGPLDFTAGLFKPQWGTSLFYRPTDYFFPLPPLQWERDESLASEGADLSLFLFDDLSLEGAARWLSEGTPEGVVRLVDKGIGITVTPSMACLTDRDGLGLEAVGTFPKFQLRLEGVEWLYRGGSAKADWIAGFSTSHQGIQYSAEVLQDGSGEILGAASDGSPQATYVYLLASGNFFPQWKASPGFVAPLEGGPLLFWPQVRWAFQTGWDLGFQAQWPIGEGRGPLDLVPGRTGISMEYQF
jgi:hypothetical protein